MSKMFTLNGSNYEIIESVERNAIMNKLVSKALMQPKRTLVAKKRAATHM